MYLENKSFESGPFVYSLSLFLFQGQLLRGQNKQLKAPRVWGWEQPAAPFHALLWVLVGAGILRPIAEWQTSASLFFK